MRVSDHPEVPTLQATFTVSNDVMMCRAEALEGATGRIPGKPHFESTSIEHDTSAVFVCRIWRRRRIMVANGASERCYLPQIEDLHLLLDLLLELGLADRKRRQFFT